MKITYDKTADALYINLNEYAEVSETQEVRPDLMLNKAEDGTIVGIEILCVSSGRPTDSLKVCNFEIAS